MDREEIDLRGFSREQIGNFFLLLVAISHRTSPLGKPPLEGWLDGVHKRGWDYLSAKLDVAAYSNPNLLTPSCWAAISEDELRTLLKDPDLGDRITDPAGRAAMIRNLGHVMLSNGWKSAERLYDLSGGRIATGEPNLIQLLTQFEAYRDPIRKKSYFFLSLMSNSALWSYVDEKHLGPAVDYHEIRGHLRLGTVTVKDEVLRQKLLDQVPVTVAEDIAIRGAVHDAIMLLSELSGLHTLSQLHYLFWNVFRSCCSRDFPHCHGCPPDCPLPQRYVPLAIHSDGQRRCPFAGICAGKCCNAHERLYEHVIDTDYY